MTDFFLNLIPETLADPKFVEAWKEWVQYRIELKHKLPPTTARKQLAKLGKYPVSVAIAMLEQSMEQGWIGFFELIQNKTNGHIGPDRNASNMNSKRLGQYDGIGKLK